MGICILGLLRMGAGIAARDPETDRPCVQVAHFSNWPNPVESHGK